MSETQPEVKPDQKNIFDDDFKKDASDSDDIDPNMPDAN